MTTPICGPEAFMRKFKDRCSYDGHPLDEQQVSALEKEIGPFFILKNESYHTSAVEGWFRYKGEKYQTTAEIREQSIRLFYTMNSFDYDTLNQIAREVKEPDQPADKTTYTAESLRDAIENYRFARTGITSLVEITNSDALAFYEFLAGRINQPDFLKTWNQLNDKTSSVMPFPDMYLGVLQVYLERKGLIKKTLSG